MFCVRYHFLAQNPARLQTVYVLYMACMSYIKHERVFHRDIQTPRRKLKIRRAAEYFLAKFEVFG